ncbi:MAG: squalene/phytoene synthase family protein, partial [Microvirga sp.]
DEILSRHGLVRDDIAGGRGGPGLEAALADMRAVARRHLAQTKTLQGGISGEVRPAFRPLALVEPYLKRMERRDYDPFQTVVEVPQWRKLLALWRDW